MSELNIQIVNKNKNKKDNIICKKGNEITLSIITPNTDIFISRKQNKKYNIEELENEILNLKMFDKKLLLNSCLKTFSNKDKIKFFRNFLYDNVNRKKNFSNSIKIDYESDYEKTETETENNFETETESDYETETESDYEK